MTAVPLGSPRPSPSTGASPRASTCSPSPTLKSRTVSVSAASSRSARDVTSSAARSPTATGASYRRDRAVHRLPQVGRAERHDPLHMVVHGVCDLRHRLWFRERTHRQRRRLGDAPGPGRCCCGHRHNMAPDRLGSGRGSCRHSGVHLLAEGGAPRLRTGQPAGPWALAGCESVVLAVRLIATSPWASSTARNTAEPINRELERNGI